MFICIICNFVDRKFQIAESPRPRRGKTQNLVLEIISIITEVKTD